MAGHGVSTSTSGHRLCLSLLYATLFLVPAALNTSDTHTRMHMLLTHLPVVHRSFESRTQTTSGQCSPAHGPI